MAALFQPLAGSLHRSFGVRSFTPIGTSGLKARAPVNFTTAQTATLSKHTLQPLGPLPARYTQTTCSAATASFIQCDENKSSTQQLLGALTAAAGIVAAYCVLASAFQSSSLFASLTLAASENNGIHVAAKSAWAGLAAGFLHTLCGPDHLAALTPLTIGRGRAAASALGALWGFGHSTGQLILGMVFVVLKDRFHDFVPALSKWAGTIVGLTLIAIGLMGIYETYFEAGHEEEHELAPELAMAGAEGGTVGAKKAPAGWATYATGIIYGLQPDALFVVIPALALPTKLAAIAYCSMFVVGTVTAMGGYTAVIGTTSAALTKERPWLQSHLSTIASGVAVVVGAAILLSGFGLNLPFFG